MTRARGAGAGVRRPARTPLRYSTVFNRVWAPARKAAALDWAGLHALRHTCASLLIDEGRSPVQIAAWLGHHSPAF
jgi:integrase